MKCFKLCIVAIIITLCMSSLVFGNDNDQPKIDPQPYSTSSSTSTTAASKPTTVSTTTQKPGPTPNTTTIPTTTQTPTPAPNTTTTSTTTQKPAPTPNTTTTSTTEKPSPAPPTPAPGPTPEPNITIWSWKYANTNRTCLLGQAAMQFEILQPNSNVTLKMNLPNDTNIAGQCEGANEEEITFSWGSNNSVIITFEKTNASKYEIKSVSSNLNVTLANTTGPQLLHLIHTTPEYETSLTNSYKCVRLQTLNLTAENSNVTAGYLHVSHLQYQAFRNETGTKFDSAWDCDGTNTPDIVPVVVGCVLAVLVVLVLVAYLFGRRRCHARGYLSMFAETGKTDSDYIPMKNLSCFN